jgi:hypothetical protein
LKNGSPPRPLRRIDRLRTLDLPAAVDPQAGSEDVQQWDQDTDHLKDKGGADHEKPTPSHGAVAKARASSPSVSLRPVISRRGKLRLML